MEKVETEDEIHQPEEKAKSSASEEEDSSSKGLVKNLSLLESLLKNNMIDFISK